MLRKVLNRLLHIVAKVPGIFQQTICRVIEVAFGIRLKQMSDRLSIISGLLNYFNSVKTWLKPGTLYSLV